MSRSTIAIATVLVASTMQFPFPNRCLAFQGAARPTVTRAADVLQTPASRVDLGTQLTFNLLSTPEAADIHRQGFQVRIFSLPQNESLPRPAREIDDCNIYFTNVLTVPGGTSLSI